MKYIISGKNIEVTDGLRSAVYEKLDRLEKYFNEDTEVQVTFSVEKDRQKMEVTIPIKGNIIRAEQVSDDMYVSIDLVTEVIERQISRHKKKLIDQAQSAAFFQKSFIEEDIPDDDEIEIIRSKKFAVKPMDPEEAWVQICCDYISWKIKKESRKEALICRTQQRMNQLITALHRKH